MLLFTVSTVLESKLLFELPVWAPQREFCVRHIINVLMWIRIHSALSMLFSDSKKFNFIYVNVLVRIT